MSEWSLLGNADLMHYRIVLTPTDVNFVPIPAKAAAIKTVVSLLNTSGSHQRDAFRRSRVICIYDPQLLLLLERKISPRIGPLFHHFPRKGNKKSVHVPTEMHFTAILEKLSSNKSKDKYSPETTSKESAPKSLFGGLKYCQIYFG